MIHLIGNMVISCFFGACIVLSAQRVRWARKDNNTPELVFWGVFCLFVLVAYALFLAALVS